MITMTHQYRFTLRLLLILLASTHTFAESPTQYPAYLTEKYCDDTSYEFITSTIKSLGKFIDSGINTKYKGGIRNTQKFLSQRKHWLRECQTFLLETKSAHLFKDKQTTNKIFRQIQQVEQELTALIDGVSYSSETGSNTTGVITEAFKQLSDDVNQYLTMMQIRGRWVYN